MGKIDISKYKGDVTQRKIIKEVQEKRNSEADKEAQRVYYNKILDEIAEELTPIYNEIIDYVEKGDLATLEALSAFNELIANVGSDYPLARKEIEETKENFRLKLKLNAILKNNKANQDLKKLVNQAIIKTGGKILNNYCYNTKVDSFNFTAVFEWTGFRIVENRYQEDFEPLSLLSKRKSSNNTSIRTVYLKHQSVPKIITKESGFIKFKYSNILCPKYKLDYEFMVRNNKVLLKKVILTHTTDSTGVHTYEPTHKAIIHPDYRANELTKNAPYDIVNNSDNNRYWDCTSLINKFYE